ncbi:winged helix-turn-helix domain-containing protein [Candidatus Bathyarchaeota archaeon]|nr:winged helix-turn-helix domain-containing protein [Candidatus Bathyarchaeota archaeon]
MNQRIKKQILDYVMDHPGASDAEISEALNMYIVDVTAVLLELEQEGLIEEFKVNYPTLSDGASNV